MLEILSSSGPFIGVFFLVLITIMLFRFMESKTIFPIILGGLIVFAIVDYNTANIIQFNGSFVSK